MQLEPSHSPLRSKVKVAMAALMMLLLLGSSLLSVSSFHARLHQHESKDDAGHPCVLCVFAHGHVAMSDSTPPLIVREVLISTKVPAALLADVPSPDCHFQPGRAPPVS